MIGDQQDADRVSVLVPSYRPETSTVACLESLAAQTHPRVQVLLSLDHAPNHHPPEFPAQKDLQVYQQPKRLGWVGNVNWLLRQVRTPYFMILSHDDRLSPTFISEVVAALQKDPSLIVAHGATHHFGIREGEVAFTPDIRGERMERLLDFLGRRPERAEMGWRGAVRSEAIKAGLHLRSRRSDGMFSNTLWVLELLTHGASAGIEGIHYDKFTDPVLGLSRDYHRRSRAEKSAMLADNLACLVDIVKSAGFTEQEQQILISRYAAWLLSFKGTWDVLGDTPGTNRETIQTILPAVTEFMANTLLSMLDKKDEA